MFVAKKHTTSSNNIKKWRARGFSLLISLFALALFAAGGFEFFNAWILREPDQIPHLWHISELVGLAILLGGTMLTLLRQPEKKPLLAQFLVIAIILQSDYAGSWGGAGGLFAVIAGIWYILFTLLEAHKTEQKSLNTVPVPVNIHEDLPALAAGKLDATVTRNTKQLVEV